MNGWRENMTDGGTRQTVPCGGTWAPCRNALEDVRIDAARQ